MNSELTRKAVISAFCSLAVIGGALAQEKDSAQDQKAAASDQKAAPAAGKDKGPVSKPPIAGVSLTPLGITIEQKAIIAPGYRASKLVKADVYNDKGEKIGKIGDLVVAPDGTLSVAVVDVSGFLGMKKHHVAIPVKQFSEVSPKRVVLPGATKDALKQLPEFTYLS
jgi:sporulation protein YlmC with PRC-barrel domain